MRARVRVGMCAELSFLDWLGWLGWLDWLDWQDWRGWLDWLDRRDWQNWLGWLDRLAGLAVNKSAQPVSYLLLGPIELLATGIS